MKHKLQSSPLPGKTRIPTSGTTTRMEITQAAYLLLRSRNPQLMGHLPENIEFTPEFERLTNEALRRELDDPAFNNLFKVKRIRQLPHGVVRLDVAKRKRT